MTKYRMKYPLKRAVILPVLLFSLFYHITLPALFASDILSYEELKSGMAKQPVEYKVSPNDILQINVYQEPDLTLLARVSSRGFISYPLLGQVKVSGMSVAEVEREITRLLQKDYLVSPQVTIFIKEFNLSRITVTGSIKDPGSYDIPPGRTMTLMQAISIAGGFTQVANRARVRIIRWEDNKEKTIEVDTRNITGRRASSQDIELKADDMVYVPESFF